MSAGRMTTDLLNTIRREGAGFTASYGPVTGRMACAAPRAVSARLKMIVCTVLAERLSAIDPDYYLDLDYSDPELTGDNLPSSLLMAWAGEAHIAIPLTWTARTLTIGAAGGSETITILLQAPDAGERLTTALVETAGNFFSYRAETKLELVA